MAPRPNRVLYLRVPTELGDRLDRLAEGSGLSLTAVATEVLLRGLGMRSTLVVLGTLLDKEGTADESAG